MPDDTSFDNIFPNDKLESDEQFKNDFLFKNDVDHLRSGRIEETRERILDSLNSAESQICRSGFIQQLLFLPPPSPPKVADFEIDDISENDGQNNDDSDRYQKEMVELRAAESLFCEENDLFIENSLKL